MSTHYGYKQEVLRLQEERCEQQDLEKRLAEIYARIDGGEDASDLTAPRGALQLSCGMQRSAMSFRVLCVWLTRPRRAARAVRALITSGAVSRPPALTCYTPPLLGAAEGMPTMDVCALAQAAFSSTPPAASPGAQLPVRPASGALAGVRAAPAYNRAIGVDPAARPRKLSTSEAAEARGLRVTETSFRDLTLPD